MGKEMIGKQVTVTVDRPLGSRHPKYTDTVYTVNYGFVKGVIGGDGEWQDAYILGVDEPVTELCGVVAAIIKRRDDNEEKWVVLPRNCDVTREQIASETHFIERYFDSEIVM